MPKINISAPKSQFSCRYCKTATFASSQGLNSHLLLKIKCRQQMNAEIEAKRKAEVATQPTGSKASEKEHAAIEAMDFDDDLIDFHLNEVELPPFSFSGDPDVDPASQRIASSSSSSQASRRACIDDVSQNPDWRWVEDYPTAAGTPINQDKIRTSFEVRTAENEKEGKMPWYPFESQEEWELGRWLMTSGVSQSKINSFLKLDMVSSAAARSFI